MTKYLIDSNCYVDAARDDGERERLLRFTSWAAPRLYLSSVVAAELRAGARSVRDRRLLDRLVLAPFVRTARIVTPQAGAWDALGRALSDLRMREGLDPGRVTRAFAFDALIAYSCREAGLVLVTKNTGDMRRLQGVFRFRFVEPYPTRVA